MNNKQVSIVAIGAGNRTNKYLEYVKQHPDKAKLVGVVELNEIRRNKIAEKLDRTVSSLKNKVFQLGLGSQMENNYDGIRTKADEVMSETLEEWTSGAQFIADAWNADDGESVKAQVTQAHEEISRAADEYQQKVDDVATTVGQDFSEDGIAGAIGDAKTATEELQRTGLNYAIS